MRPNALAPQLPTIFGMTGGSSLQRQDFVAAAFRLPDGDPWKEKVLNELRLNPKDVEIPRQWMHKSNTENFKR